jgi:hypothetical protein
MPVKPKCGICKRRVVHPDGDPTLCRVCQETAEQIWGGLIPVPANEETDG